MSETTELQAQDQSTQSMTVSEIHRQIQLIQEVMKNEMKEGEHYGTVPGCGDKKVLLKSGAEKLNLLFKMAPRFKVENVDLGNGHREVRITTELYHIVTGKFLGEGLGSCSTLESKYRYRNAGRKCPACEQETIIKGKQEYGGGWICFAKKGGCGAKFKDGDTVIELQAAGRLDNPDIADTYNTVLKIGKKRSMVDAALTVTAASDLFTQDIEENAEIEQPTKAQPAPARIQEDPADIPFGEEPPPDDSDVVVGDEPPVSQRTTPAATAPKSTASPAGLPKDRRRMQSKFASGTCKGCKKGIAKEQWIYQAGPGDWRHEVGPAGQPC